MLHDDWREHARVLLTEGQVISTREQQTRELIDQRLKIDARWSLLDVPARKLNYRFAVAEWIWMMFGRSDLASLAQYNSIMKQFSDDGLWLTGAYGPHIRAQRDETVAKLMRDPYTRQAVIEIPRPRKHTKDEPCTLSMQFLYRANELSMIVTMRSSDVWLGVPYDLYTFSQILNCFAGHLGWPRGFISLQMGSSHLYERDVPAIETVLGAAKGNTLYVPDLPGFPPDWLEDVLVKRDHGLFNRTYGPNLPWVPYADALLSHTSDDARNVLRAMTGQPSTVD